MRRVLPAAVALALCAAAPAPDRTAATHALAAASAAASRAAAAGNQWLPTLAALKTAKAALKADDFAASVAAAKHAERLAGLSLTQAREQKKLWPNEVPH